METPKRPWPRRMTILDLGHACDDDDDARYGHIVARRIAGEEEGLGRDGKLNGAFVMGADSALHVLK